MARLEGHARRSTTTRRDTKMLGDHPIEVVLLATDLEASREFFAEKVGLEVVRETDYAVWFKTGNEGGLSISASTTGTADEQDQATWRVDDVRAEVVELRSRGVEILEFDTPQIKTEDGVADVGHAFAAWFVDPGKNSLSILQYK
jgi:catechol 2,3-dioxygenase-like lactoylglutathione lyase family enzyme